MDALAAQHFHRALREIDAQHVRLSRLVGELGDSAIKSRDDLADLAGDRRRGDGDRLADRPVDDEGRLADRDLGAGSLRERSRRSGTLQVTRPDTSERIAADWLADPRLARLFAAIERDDETC